MKEFTMFFKETGLKVTMRTLKLRDEDKFVNSKGSQFLKSLFDMLNACTLGIVEPGLYASKIKEGKLYWEDTWEGDWFDAMLTLRGYSFTDDYTFRTSCSYCQDKVSITQRLSELERKTMPDMTREVLENPVEGSGSDIVYKDIEGLGKVGVSIHTGRRALALINEKKLKVKKGSNLGPRSIEQAIRDKIVSINNLKPKELDCFISDLDAKDASLLLELIEEVNWGVEMKIENKCDWCGAWFDLELPFEKSFFFPKGSTK